MRLSDNLFSPFSQFCQPLDNTDKIDPTITPAHFWEVALNTGRTIQIAHEGKEYALGPILDPAALIAALQK